MVTMLFALVRFGVHGDDLDHSALTVAVAVDPPPGPRADSPEVVAVPAGFPTPPTVTLRFKVPAGSRYPLRIVAAHFPPIAAGPGLRPRLLPLCRLCQRWRSHIWDIQSPAMPARRN